MAMVMLTKDGEGACFKLEMIVFGSACNAVPFVMNTSKSIETIS
jgi:hypothetical protein